MKNIFFGKTFGSVKFIEPENYIDVCDNISYINKDYNTIFPHHNLFDLNIKAKYANKLNNLITDIKINNVIYVYMTPSCIQNTLRVNGIFTNNYYDYLIKIANIISDNSYIIHIYNNDLNEIIHPKIINHKIQKNNNWYKQMDNINMFEILLKVLGVVNKVK